MGALEGHGDPPTVATEAMTHDAHYALSIESLKTDKNNRGNVPTDVEISGAALLALSR
jgi:hypothetical protein